MCLKAKIYGIEARADKWGARWARTELFALIMVPAPGESVDGSLRRFGGFCSCYALEFQRQVRKDEGGAAVYVDQLACDPGGFFGADQGDGVADVGWRS